MTRRWLSADFFTDEKMKRATVPERLLAAAIIASQDDDGRLRGDPAYLRSIAFLYDDYTLDEVKEMRDHLAQVNPNIIVYENAGDQYIQLKRYQRYQKPRYYHPSRLPEPPGWPFKEDSNQTVPTQQPSSNPMSTTKHPTGDHVVTQGEGKDKDKNLDLDKGEGKGKGANRDPTPSSVAILDKLKDCHESGWAKKPNPKESAQLRDLAKELSVAGCPLDYIQQAFKEAAEMNKLSISYVRAILFAWLGRGRDPP